jgi:hypothetical protein
MAVGAESMKTEAGTVFGVVFGVLLGLLGLGFGCATGYAQCAAARRRAWPDDGNGTRILLRTRPAAMVNMTNLTLFSQQVVHSSTSR